MACQILKTRNKTACLSKTIKKESQMLQFIFCLFGLHGATEIDYTVDDEEIKVCRDCLKEVK